MGKSIFDTIWSAKALLVEQGVKPKYIKASPSAHLALLDELNKRNNTKSVRVFEACGLIVDIEDECPPHAAYLLGEEQLGERR